MALQDFIHEGNYSKISQITLDLDMKEISFTLRTLSSSAGTEVIPAILFQISYQEEVEKYLERNPASLPDIPEYPIVCSDREAMVPMWPDGVTQEEINDYTNAKIAYQTELQDYYQTIKLLKEQALVDAKTKNVFMEYFAPVKLFTTSNPVSCAYNYIKAQDSFIGVNDVD